jgi:hypothetical protein
MKYAILSLGVIAAGFFLWSVYAFALTADNFKIAAYGFLVCAIIFFILIIIRKIMEDKRIRDRR